MKNNWNLSENVHHPNECSVCKIDDFSKVYFESDVKEFIRLLKDRKCMFSDSVIYCKTCKKEKHLVMCDASMCFDCYIDKIAGEKLK